MIKVSKVASTEELLKIYFFKLYSCKNKISLSFDEEIGNLISSKTFEELTSEDLFQRCFIEKRWGNTLMYGEDKKLPDFLYYFDYGQIKFENIDSHPFLYTSIELVKNTQIYEAKVGHYLSEFYDNNGVYLGLSICPNLYDDGTEEIFAINENLICNISWDENNSFYSSFYTFNDGNLNRLNFIESKEEILAIIDQFEIPDILNCASESLRADKEVVLASIYKYPDSIDYASDSLKNDKEFIDLTKINLKKNDKQEDIWDENNLPF
jgi:hypothetical protein